MSDVRTSPEEVAAAGEIYGPEGRGVLEFQTLAELCAEVDAAGPRVYLVRGMFPAGTYGVLGAEQKAGKTWAATDLAVSVASGTPFFEAFAIDDPGPVLMFAGEGGKAGIVRRLRAVCASRGIAAESLPIVVCVRAPHLSDDAHLELVRQLLDKVKPRLVLVDPLYLAAGGADGRDLYAMGRLLERVQHLTEAADAALLVVTHYNRREGNGASRFTGAGPAEWGRVLIGARVVSRSTDPATRATSVTLELEIVGGEVPDQTIRVRREIAADDPDDLDSPLRYAVEVLPADDDASDKAADDWRPTVLMERVVEFLRSQSEPVNRSAITTGVRGKKSYVVQAIDLLIADGIATESVGAHGAKLVALAVPVPFPFPEQPGTGTTERNGDTCSLFPLSTEGTGTGTPSSGQTP